MKNSPLEKFTIVESRDPDEISEHLSRRFRRIQTTPMKARANFEKPVRLSHVPLRNTTMSVASIELGVKSVCFTDEPLEFIPVLYPSQGSADFTLGSTKFIGCEDVAAIPGSDELLHMSTSEDYVMRAFMMRRETFEKHLSTLLGQPLKSRLEFESCIDFTKGAGAQVKLLLEQCLHDLASPHSLMAQGMTGRTFEQMLIATLLHAQPHNYQHLLKAPIELVAPYYVRRAKEYMREHLAETVSSETLVEVTGVSASSLYKAFQRYYDTSPAAWFKHQKLKQVREDLLNHDCDDGIKGVALRWGFNHMGKFANDYRKAFGELPSETLRQRKLFPFSG